MSKEIPLDRILAVWRDTSVPTKTLGFLNKKFPLQGPANQRVEDATIQLCLAVANAIDAFRVHPHLTYGNAIQNIENLIGNLPEPEKTGEIPEGLALTPEERIALVEGRGDRPLGG